MKYRIVGRFMYEAVYDVGPQAFKDVRDRDKENIDSFKQAYDLWECYADLSKGPAFLRIGRQNLSWGETDVFRLLDMINPLDDTYGGLFEDLDDRRIPLWMLRGSYNFGYLGPISSLNIEGFWVPGNWDARVAPISPDGTPYAIPLAPAPVPVLVETPGKAMSNSRWGVRLQGVLLDSANLSVGHYKSFMDLPSTRPERGLLRIPPGRQPQALFRRRAGHGRDAEFLGVPPGHGGPERGGLVLEGVGLHPGRKHPARTDGASDSGAGGPSGAGAQDRAGHPEVDDRVGQEPVDPEAEPDADLLRLHAVLRPVDVQLGRPDQSAAGALSG